MNYILVFFETIFILSQVIIALFSLHYFYIVLRNLLLSKRVEITEIKKLNSYPFVTIQVPIYNEKHIVKDFIMNIIGIDYPKNKFEIQLLDDSTDETSSIIDKEIIKYPSIDFVHIKRQNRIDFKAGALNEGLLMAKGEFIAIFDIDFNPPRSFLQKSLVKFQQNSKLAFVQTRWGHKNKDETILTKAIALGIDNHFLIEQPVRNQIGVMNFNGTSGIFRKEAIVNAGLWDGSILAEDLDISYRLYMKNWTAEYMKDVICKGEIPNKISSYKTQQYRWAKGSSQACKKNFLAIMKSKNLSPIQKTESVFHHLGYVIQLCIFLNIISTIPLIFYTSSIPLSEWGLLFFIINLLASTMYLVTAYKLKMDVSETLKYILLLTMLTIGISWKTTIACFEGLVHRSGDFKRTPKGISTNKNIYLIKSKLDLIIEFSLIMYVMGGLIIAYLQQQYSPMLYLLFCLLAFGYIFVLDLKEQINIELYFLRIPQSLKKIFNSSN